MATNPADHNASRQEAMYQPEKKAAKGGKEAKGERAGHDVHGRHKKERADMHKRHAEARDALHKSHETEHAALDARQADEIAQNADAGTAAATGAGTAMAPPVGAAPGAAPAAG